MTSQITWKLVILQEKELILLSTYITEYKTYYHIIVSCGMLVRGTKVVMKRSHSDAFNKCTLAQYPLFLAQSDTRFFQLQLP